MRIPYGQVQGSGYNACTGKYCIICPGAQKNKKTKKNKLKAVTSYSVIALMFWPKGKIIQKRFFVSKIPPQEACQTVFADNQLS
jgi:hypothetical protein